MKKEEKHPILKAIPYTRKITRKELQSILNMDDRIIRDLINKARKDTAIISSSKEKGYRRARPIDKCTRDELLLEYNEILHCIREINSRIDDFKKQKRPLIAYLKVVEKELNKSTAEQWTTC